MMYSSRSCPVSRINGARACVGGGESSMAGTKGQVVKRSMMLLRKHGRWRDTGRCIVLYSACVVMVRGYGHSLRSPDCLYSKQALRSCCLRRSGPLACFHDKRFATPFIAENEYHAPKAEREISTREIQISCLTVFEKIMTAFPSPIEHARLPYVNRESRQKKHWISIFPSFKSHSMKVDSFDPLFLDATAKTRHLFSSYTILQTL